jgi:tRNA uridine 5-carboxymethylaminomethyl modification enzyme
MHSAFDMLRNPKITTHTLREIVPGLATIDPYILSRVDVDGMSHLAHFAFHDLTK